MPDMIPIPMTEAYRFDCDVLKPGTPVLYRNKVNEHDFHGLVSEATVSHITITNGFMEIGISIEEVVDGEFNLYPMMNPGAVTEYETRIFNECEIPLGSMLWNTESETALMVYEVHPYEVTLINAQGTKSHMMSYEVSDHEYLILPGWAGDEDES